MAEQGTVVRHASVPAGAHTSQTLQAPEERREPRLGFEPGVGHPMPLHLQHNTHDRYETHGCRVGAESARRGCRLCVERQRGEQNLDRQRQRSAWKPAGDFFVPRCPDFDVAYAM